MTRNKFSNTYSYFLIVFSLISPKNRQKIKISYAGVLNQL